MPRAETGALPKDAPARRGRSSTDRRKNAAREKPESVLSVAETDPGPSEVDTAALPSTASENSDERHQRIAEAAYARAEQRGFEPGREVEDWLSAESELYGDDSASRSSSNGSRGRQ